MRSTRISFFANLALVVITASIIVTYIFESTENQCQMTFMMEPPKFIPVPIERSHTRLDQAADQNTPNRHHLDYKLFMYSEFGFPLTSDVRRDLKDSMPVLFVPGNAGSYQQVRSLASTCIRRQLQSLEAYKFVFYTIDFRDELSGLSGNFVEDQIGFVHEAIDQIISMHPSDTNGIILIGHSVGGFITKAVFNRPGFDAKSVPLLINLASPLTRAYLNFDTKMKELYQNVSDHWSKQSHSIGTISISISGGKFDKLVPKHLSLDEQYDLALTTSATRGVWLATDHVCITWCRELMHKLAHLLSALMDKKHTRLISDKKEALNIIKTELLTHNIRYYKQRPSVISKESRITKSYVTQIIDGYYSATRNQLIDEMIIVNMTTRDQTKDYLMWLEHIESLKEAALYGCQSVDGDSPTICNSKFDLISMSKLIPSRRFEPKKTVIGLNRDTLNNLNYIVLDFSSNSREGSILNKVPELVSIIPTDLGQHEDLVIPNVFDYVVAKVASLFFKNQHIPINHKKQPLVFKTYQLKNLIHTTQFISVSIQSKNCASAQSKERLASVYNGDHLIESFHPDKNTQELIVKLSSLPTIIVKESKHEFQEQTLELLIDGSCDNSIRLEVDVWTLIENTIQVHLAEILTLSTFLAYAAIIRSVSDFEKLAKHQKLASSSSKTTLVMKGVICYLLCSVSSNAEFKFGYLSDEIVRFSLIYFLSSGTIAFLQYVLKRIVDLATITNNIQTLIRNKISNTRSRDKTIESNGAGCHVGSGKKKKDDEPKNRDDNKNNLNINKSAHNSMGNTFDWALVALALLSSIWFSEANMSGCMLLIIIKLAVSLNAAYYRSQSSNQTTTTTTRHCCEPPTSPHRTSHELDLYEVSFELVIKIAALCSLSLISSIPAALVRINMNRLEVLGSESLASIHFMAPSASLLLVKFICDHLDRTLHLAPGVGANNKTSLSIANMLSKYLHFSTLPLIALIGADMRRISLVLLVLLVWISLRLPSHKAKTTLIERTDIDRTTAATNLSKHNKID